MPTPTSPASAKAPRSKRSTNTAMSSPPAATSALSRSRLSEMQSAILRTYEDRILPLDRVGTEWAAEFRAQARRAGRTIDVGDVLIAGIAKAHHLTVVTRNIAHFRALAVDVVNPWDPL